MPLVRVLVAMTKDMYVLFLFMTKGYMDENLTSGPIWCYLGNVSCKHVDKISKKCTCNIGDFKIV